MTNQKDKIMPNNDQEKSNHESTNLIKQLEKRVSELLSINQHLNNELKIKETNVKIFELFNTALFNASLDTIVLIDKYGTILNININGAKRLGYSRDELIGKNVYSLLSDEVAKFRKAKLDHVLQTGQPITFIDKRDGYLFSHYVYPVYDEHHQIFGVGLFVKDISKEKEAEESLKVSEERFRTLIENLPIGVFRSSVDGKFHTINPAFKSMFGLAIDIDHNNLNAIDFYADPKDRDDLITSLEKTEKVSGFEIRFKKSDGILFWGKMSASKVTNSNGSILYIDGIIENIDQQKQIKRELKNYQDHLEDIVEERTKELKIATKAADKANNAKSEFLANISHELRTPISNIIGVANMLMDRISDHTIKKNIEIINLSANSLLHIINDILDISKIEANRIELNIEPFDLHELINQTIQQFSHAIQQKHLEFNLTFQPDIPRFVEGDSNRLGQVLRNLLSNAIKFTNKGYIALEVRHIDSSPIQHELVLSVSDSGVGISETKKDHLFQKFSQLDQTYSKKYPGTGLGLVISKGLVEQMGGRIWVKSQQGKGSTFYFSIVLHRTSDSSFDQSKSDDHPFNEKQYLSILYAEDVISLRESTSYFLKKIGHQVTMVSNGKQVLEYLNKQHFDLILMDIQMPEMDGIETTKRIRQSKTKNFNSNIPIIAVTAYAMKNEHDRMKHAGFDDYLTKPFIVDDLLIKINRLISFNKKNVALKNSLPTQSTVDSPTHSTDDNMLKDLNNFISIFKNNHQVVKSIITNFFSEADGRMIKLKQAIQDKDMTQIKQAAHKMTSLFSSIQVRSPAYICQELERSANNNQEHECNQLFNQLTHTFNQLIKDIHDLKI